MFLVFCFVETGQAPIYTVRWDIEQKVWKTIILFYFNMFNNSI